MIKAFSRGRNLFLLKSLVALIFVSKLSLGSLVPIPKSWGYFIYQQGLHPYMNVILCCLLGIPLIYFYFAERGKPQLSPLYKIFLFFLALVLVVQTILQIVFVSGEESFFAQIGALAITLFMLMTYGVAIPQLWSWDKFLTYVQRWSGALVILSVAMLIFNGANVFKGGRFIGLFKHIPHMVSCATVAFIFSLGLISEQKKLKHNIWNGFVLVVSLLAVFLTGTRSALMACLAAGVLYVILYRTQTNGGKLFKFSFLSSMCVFALFFGGTAFEYIRGLASGEAALAGRGAQDGLASRWEEVERGAQIFSQEPWMGHGLASKFSAGREIDFTHYSALKDPHNMFLSAAVVGGWPLLFLCLFGLAFLCVAIIKNFVQINPAARPIGIYLAAHLPILVIYHIHLSIGGMADRIYWLCFGFMALQASRSFSCHPTIAKAGSPPS